jgi:hypothetical protein
MSYRIVGIDVHKKLLAVVLSDVAVEGDHLVSAEEVRHFFQPTSGAMPMGW